MFEIKVKEDKINSKVLQVQLKGKERELLEFSNTYHLIVVSNCANITEYDEATLVRFLGTLKCKDERFKVISHTTPSPKGNYFINTAYTVMCNGVKVFYDCTAVFPPIRNSNYVKLEDFIAFLKSVKELVEEMEEAIKDWDVNNTPTETIFEV